MPRRRRRKTEQLDLALEPGVQPAAADGSFWRAVDTYPERCGRARRERKKLVRPKLRQGRLFE